MNLRVEGEKGKSIGKEKSLEGVQGETRKDFRGLLDKKIAGFRRDHFINNRLILCGNSGYSDGF